MVRGKVELGRMKDGARRPVSFSKRRDGLLKEARELAARCDAEVGVIAISPQGKLSHFSSRSSLEKTIQRYKRSLDTISVSNHSLKAEGHDRGSADQNTKHGVLEKEDQRSFGDQNIEQVNVNVLTKVEEKLESLLGQVRSRKAVLLTDLLTKLRTQERTLVSENQQLQPVVGGDGEEDEPCGSDGNSGSDSSSSNDGAPPPTPPSRMT